MIDTDKENEIVRKINIGTLQKRVDRSIGNYLSSYSDCNSYVRVEYEWKKLKISGCLFTAITRNPNQIILVMLNDISYIDLKDLILKIEKNTKISVKDNLLYIRTDNNEFLISLSSNEDAQNLFSEIYKFLHNND